MGVKEGVASALEGAVGESVRLLHPRAIHIPPRPGPEILPPPIPRTKREEEEEEKEKQDDDDDQSALSTSRWGTPLSDITVVGL